MTASFSSEWYLACNPDIGMDPLEHYTRQGRDQGLLPNGYVPGAVDREWYLQRYSDLAEGTDPALHYVTRGWLEGRDPNPEFSTRWYSACYPNLGMNPLVHYLIWGRDEGRLANGRGPGAVDEAWYRARYRDVDRKTDAAVHYAEIGWREGRDPNAHFSTGWYQANYPGIGMNPLIHYLQYGRAEGRSPRPTFRQTVRSAEWLSWKLGPLFAMAYATVLHLDLSFRSACAPLLIILAAIVPGAAYAAMINDLTDRADDASVGKPNAMAGRSPLVIGGLLACCLGPGAGFLVLWRHDPLLFCTYFAAWVIFSIYSFPPIRLKTKGVWGAVAEAAASGLLPTLVAVAVIYWWFRASMDVRWLSLIGLWSFAFAMRGILGHQLLDRHNDDKAIVRTFVQRHGAALTGTLIGVSFAIEVGALIGCLVSLGSIAVGVVTIAAAAVDVFVTRSLRMKTVVVPPDGEDGGRSKLALHSYYQIYLPFGILLHLAFADMASAIAAMVAFFALSLEPLQREWRVLFEAVVRNYYPLQPVVDRPRQGTPRTGGGA